MTAFRVLGLESSCDETAAAIVDDGRIVRSDVVASQNEVHARYGGVVPELASRAHILNIVPVVQAALERAGTTLAEVDGIAVTNAPGLVGALLVGLQTAKAIAWVTGKPLVGVHHLEGHLTAIYLEPDPPPLPHLALIVSGGHTSLVLVEGHGRPKLEGPGFTRVPGPKLEGAGFTPVPGPKLEGAGFTPVPGPKLEGAGFTPVPGPKLEGAGFTPVPGIVELGATRDDAAGEAFDKGAKLLGLGYPGGAVIDKLAKTGDPRSTAFPRSMTAGEHGADFSFSGLKTALLHHVRAHGVPDGQPLADLCASYQAAIVEVLVRKTRRAARRLGIAHVQICGGVAANSALRAAMIEAGGEDAFRVYVPPPARCTDNAAMIAAAGYHRLVAGERDALELDAVPNAPLARSGA